MGKSYLSKMLFRKENVFVGLEVGGVCSVGIAVWDCWCL